MTYCKNDYLTRAEMTVNAQFIATYLLGKGWAKESISAILGNMETESTINPCIWQSLNSGNMSGGYGLVQWTPATKYIDWATNRGYQITDITKQLDRLDYEIDNNLQWIVRDSNYNFTFLQFKTNSVNRSVEELAWAFLINYEAPADPNQPNRATQARYWFNNLVWEGGGIRPHFPTTEGLSITSPYGWRTHPVTGLPDFHAAIDIGGGGVNHPIYATQNGVVVGNRRSSTGGWMLYIQHTSDPYYSRYLHLASQSPIGIGTSVTRGQNIGTMGDTGVGTGIHLDFAIGLTNEGWGTEEGTIDPELYLEMTFGDGGADTVNQGLMVLLMVDALNGFNF